MGFANEVRAFDSAQVGAEEPALLTDCGRSVTLMNGDLPEARPFPPYVWLVPASLSDATAPPSSIDLAAHSSKRTVSEEERRCTQ